MDLHTAIADAIAAMDLFFNNKFSESRVRYQKWYEQLFSLLCFIVSHHHHDHLFFLTDGPWHLGCTLEVFHVHQDQFI